MCIRDRCNGITPVKNNKGLYSTLATLLKIEESDTYSWQGGTMSSKDFTHILATYGDNAYGKWNTVKQMDCTSLSSGVPIPLSVIRENHGIKYEEWDKEHSTFRYFCGYALDKCRNYTDINRKSIGLVKNLIKLHPNLVQEFREAFAVLKPRGKEYIYNLKSCNNPRNRTIGDDFYKIPGNLQDAVWAWKNITIGLVRAMLIQSWVFSPGMRDKTMVLDPLDWDFVPQSVPDSHRVTAPTVSKEEWSPC